MINEIRLIAKAIKKAAEIREKSYNNWKDYYEIELDDACEIAFKEFEINKDLVRPFQLAFHWWNDLLVWADYILEENNE